MPNRTKPIDVDTAVIKQSVNGGDNGDLEGDHIPSLKSHAHWTGTGTIMQFPWHPLYYFYYCLCHISNKMLL